MLIDILNENDSITVNLKSIKLFGITTACYLHLLIIIYKKASKKGKIDEKGFFKLDRSYIKNVLEVDLKEQLTYDLNLKNLGLLQISEEDPNLITLNINLYLSMLASEDVKLIEDVRKQIKVLKPKGLKKSQRETLIQTLKDSIQCSDYELLNALRDRVDGVFARPTGFLSKSSIKIFQETLNNYTKGDLDLALAIVRIATVQGYRDCTWAINYYEQNEKKVKKPAVKLTAQEVATKADLSDIVF